MQIVYEKKEKKSLWVRFRIFCHGVKSETLSVHWPNKKDMIRYSIATIFFIVFCAVFFYAIYEIIVRINNFQKLENALKKIYDGEKGVSLWKNNGM